MLYKRISSLAVIALIAAFQPGESAARPQLAHLGVKFGGPVGLTGSAGFAATESMVPLVVENDAGTGGAKLGVGTTFLFTTGSGGGDEPWPGLFHTLTLRGVAVRTWGKPIGIGIDRTLVGGEVEYSLLYFLTLHGGILYPVDGKPQKDYVASWGVGVHLLPLLGW